MIIQEIIQPEQEGGWALVKTYSDVGMLIRQDETGTLFSEAVDPQFVNRTYTETDIPIDADDEEITDADKAEAYDILMGDIE